MAVKPMKPPVSWTQVIVRPEEYSAHDSFKADARIGFSNFGRFAELHAAKKIPLPGFFFKP
jgi:hypothetical protein